MSETIEALPYGRAVMSRGMLILSVALACLGPMTTRADAPTHGYEAPPESAIPAGAFGDMVKRGRAIFTGADKSAAAFVGNALKCSNCHLDAGRRAHAGPLGPAYVMYPAFRDKDHQVDTFAERLRQCFLYSMNGREPPLGGDVLVALEAYAFFLAKGVPVGVEVEGRGYAKLAPPPQAPDFSRGEAVFKAKCASCHGADGAGQIVGGRTIDPPLWGDKSFNWGAGMASFDHAAGFVKANMPLGQGGSLRDQDAWDVALYLDSHERPQDPRFTGDVAATRQRFHDTAMSMYGREVGGVVLGSASPPAGPRAP